MAVEILPTTDDGLDESVHKIWSPESLKVETVTETGPTSKLESRWTYYQNIARITAKIASIEMQTKNGRGSLVIRYGRESEIGDTSEDVAIQELAQADLSRDILTAPYFNTLTNAQIIAVRTAYEEQLPGDAEWLDLQKALYGHLAHGQTSYWETIYILRMSWKTASIRQLQVASANPNEVATLPDLTPTITALVAALPAGEWLKRPTQVLGIGQGFYNIQVEYHWAPQWSVIYGGTFTGIDA